MKREIEGSVVFNGGRLTVPGKRRFDMTVLALLVTLFVFALLAYPAGAQTLTVNKTASPDPVAVGDVLTYQITVDNTGTAFAEDVSFQDPLPNNTTFVSASFTNGNVNQPCTPADDIVQCNLGDITPTVNATITIQVTPTAAAAGTNLQNTATANSTRSDPVTTTVTQQANNPDVTITKEADQTSVDVGEELTYEITVENNQPTGTDSVSGLVIRDLLPDNVNLIDVDDEDEDIDRCNTLNDDEVRCRLNELGPGDEAVLFITIEPQDDAGDEIENVARLILNGTRIDEDSVTTDVNGDDDNGDDDNGDDDNGDDDFVEEVTVDDTVDEDPDSGSADEGGVLADSTTDPDTQEPVSGPQGDVQDEIATEGPLPNTGGVPLATGASLALPVIFGVILLAVGLVFGWRRRT